MNANLTDIDYRVQIAHVLKTYEPELGVIKREKKKLQKELAKKYEELNKTKKLRNKEVNGLKASMYIDSDVYQKPEINIRYKIKYKNKYHDLFGREFYGNISIMVVGANESKYHCVVFDSEKDTIYLKVKKHKLIKFLSKKHPTFSRQLRLNKLLDDTSEYDTTTNDSDHDDQNHQPK